MTFYKKIATLGAGLLLTAMGATGVGADGNAPQPTEDELVRSLANLPEVPRKEAVSLTKYRALTVEVTLENGKTVAVWDDAIRKALAEHDAIKIPDTGEPYYIFRSIILKSGQQLQLDRGTLIKALPGMKVAMVRNAAILPGNLLPEPKNIAQDHDIVVSGGIWDYGASSFSMIGFAEETMQITGGHGVMLFSNVRGLQISGAEIRNAPCFCIHISNSVNVRAEHLTFRDSYGDGLHLNGPLRNVYAYDLCSEGTGDDILALNAWDWVNSHVTAGPIENVAVDTLCCNKGYSCIRILPGVQRYYDGSSRDCFVRNVAFRNIKNVRNFKIYAQGSPGLNYVSELGHAENLYFRRISGLSKMNRVSYREPYYGQGDQAACFEVLADVNNLVLDDLSGNFKFEDDPVVLAVGPLSMTIPVKGAQPIRYLELFPMDLSCKVRNVTFGKITGDQGAVPADRKTLIKSFQLSLKPDFIPGRDRARGGTGKGEIEGIRFL